jgi:hypothetical protein
MAAETQHVTVPQINKEHHVQIKNTHDSCMYFTCILYNFNQLNLKIFSFLRLEKWGAQPI